MLGNGNAYQFEGAFVDAQKRRYPVPRVLVPHGLGAGNESLSSGMWAEWLTVREHCPHHRYQLPSRSGLSAPEADLMHHPQFEFCDVGVLAVASMAPYCIVDLLA